MCALAMPAVPARRALPLPALLLGRRQRSATETLSQVQYRPPSFP